MTKSQARSSQVRVQRRGAGKRAQSPQPRRNTGKRARSFRSGRSTGKLSRPIRSGQKIALVCDWLTTPGGAEKVLLQLHRMYPDAPIYTSQYRPKKIDWFRDADVRTGWVNFFPVCLRRFIGLFRQIYFSHLDLSDYDVVISVTGAEAKSVRTVSKIKNHTPYPHYSTHDVKSQEVNQKSGGASRRYLFLGGPDARRFKHPRETKALLSFPRVCRIGKTLVNGGRACDTRNEYRRSPSEEDASIFFRGDDRESERSEDGRWRRAPRKSVSRDAPTKSAFHICYCHVPTQYYWRLYDKYLKEPGFGILNPIVRLGLRILVKPLRQADYRAAQRPDRFVTISQYAVQEIETYYGRKAEVIYPPVDCEQFLPTQAGTRNKTTQAKNESRSGFIISCRQVTWKRVDLAIQGCLATGQHLTVVGDGPEHRNLVRLAQGNNLIKFIPWIETAALARQLQSATAYLFPSVEPFGIAPVEALAAGCPVIAYADGGSRDIVMPGKNGLLFPEQTAESLATAIKEFDPKSFDMRTVIQSAQRFTPEKFTTAIAKIVKEQEARR